MSATIHYRKTDREDPYLKGVWAPSEFMASLERAFGWFPCVVGENEVPVLRGMAAVYAMAPNQDKNPYLEIIEKIEQLGSIELYSKY